MSPVPSRGHPPTGVHLRLRPTCSLALSSAFRKEAELATFEADVAFVVGSVAQMACALIVCGLVSKLIAITE